MSQRRKIALAYAFAVPVVLVIVLALHVGLYEVSHSAGDMAGASEVIQQTAVAVSSLKEAGTNSEAYVASPGSEVYSKGFQDSISRLRGAIKIINQKTANDRNAHNKIQKLQPMIEKQIAFYAQAMERAKKKSVPRETAEPATQAQGRVADIEHALRDLQSAELTRLQQLSGTATRSVRLAGLITSYGGGLAIWLVAVGAFLLFHDEKARAWKGVERRVHTKVLQTLPLGVSVTTDAGIIVYANPIEESSLGYKEGGLLGTSANTLHPLEEQGAEHKVREILDCLRSDHAWSGELPVKRADGTVQIARSWVLNLPVPGKIYRLFVHDLPPMGGSAPGDTAGTTAGTAA